MWLSSSLCLPFTGGPPRSAGKSTSVGKVREGITIPRGDHLTTLAWTIESWFRFAPDVDGAAAASSAMASGQAFNVKSLPHKSMGSHAVVLFENVSARALVFVTQQAIGLSFEMGKWPYNMALACLCVCVRALVTGGSLLKVAQVCSSSPPRADRAGGERFCEQAPLPADVASSWFHVAFVADPDALVFKLLLNGECRSRFAGYSC